MHQHLPYAQMFQFKTRCLAAGAYLLSVPDAVEAAPQNGTFWKALPGGPGVFWPMFVVAFAATVVASQSLISAVFQITYQAIAQGFFPRFHVYHTSREHKGQVQSCLRTYSTLLRHSHSVSQ